MVKHAGKEAHERSSGRGTERRGQGRGRGRGVHAVEALHVADAVEVPRQERAGLVVRDPLRLG